MVREELGAVLLPVPQVVFLSGCQVIGSLRVEDGHAPSHADADESVAFRRFVSHVVSIATRCDDVINRVNVILYIVVLTVRCVVGY